MTLAPVLDMRTGFPYSVIDEERNFVGGRNRCNHVRSYDARLNLENTDPDRRKARREQLGSHAEPSLGDTVIASIHRGRERGNR